MSTLSIPTTDTHAAERRKLRPVAGAGAALATFAVRLLDLSQADHRQAG
jgi:hypothetical protein